MKPIDSLVTSLALSLELLILWRGRQAGLWPYYPLLYLYVAAIFVLNATQFVLAQLHFSAYMIVYWVGASVGIVLRYLVGWEIFRQSFSRATPVRRVVGQVLVILLVGLAAGIFWGSGGGPSFFLDLERKTSFAQAVFLAATLLLSRYYGVPLGRNMLGVAVGFGMYLSVSVMNFATVELLREPFLPFWRYVRPLSFVCMLGVWTWALWVYAPNPRPAPGAVGTASRGIGEWKQAWRQVGTALRRAVGL